MSDQGMRHGKSYNVKVYYEGEYIGSAVLRRIGTHHVETSTTVLHEKYHTEIADVCRQAVGAFEFMAARPRLGELIQRSIWEIIDRSEETDQEENPPDLPF
jgi:hypothetical protein